MLALLTFLSTLFLHDFHASITQVEYKNQALQVSVRVFTEDLENELNELSQRPLSIDNAEDQPVMDSLITQMLSRDLKFSTSSRLENNYLGKEVDYDLTYLYVEIPVAKAPEQLRVENRLFFDRFDDQSNIVNVTVGDQLESAFLTPQQPSEILYFKP